MFLLFFKKVLLVDVLIKQKVRKIGLTKLLLFRNSYFYYFFFFFGGTKSILYPFGSPNAIFIIRYTMIIFSVDCFTYMLLSRIIPRHNKKQFVVDLK